MAGLAIRLSRLDIDKDSRSSYPAIQAGYIWLSGPDIDIDTVAGPAIRQSGLDIDIDSRSRRLSGLDIGIDSWSGYPAIRAGYRYRAGPAIWLSGPEIDLDSRSGYPAI